MTYRLATFSQFLFTSIVGYHFQYISVKTPQTHKIHWMVLCLRDLYNFNCLECWITKTRFRVDSSLWYSVDSTRNAKEKSLRSSWSVFEGPNGNCTKSTAHNIAFYSWNIQKQTISCRLHISLIFEHFRNHFISVVDAAVARIVCYFAVAQSCFMSVHRFSLKAFNFAILLIRLSQ